MFGIKIGRKNEIVVNGDNYEIEPVENTSRSGKFEEGFDRLGRPFRKKQYDDGEYTKEEILKDGTRKLTRKIQPEDK